MTLKQIKLQQLYYHSNHLTYSITKTYKNQHKVAQVLIFYFDAICDKCVATLKLYSSSHILHNIRSKFSYLQSVASCFGIQLSRNYLLLRLEEIKISYSELLNNSKVPQIGCVYFAYNRSFKDNICKIGATTNLYNRLKSLSGTSVPYPFELFAYIETNDIYQMESIIHLLFAEYRYNQILDKEFFEIDKSDIINKLNENNIKYMLTYNT